MKNFIIVGTFRSGTSLLSNIFNSHPDSYCLYDPCIYFFKTYRNFFYNKYLKKKINTIDNDISDYIDDSKLYILNSFLKKNHLNDTINNYYLKSLKNQLKFNKQIQQPNLNKVLNKLIEKTFFKIFEEFIFKLYKQNTNKKIKYLGTKFSWCEEFIPSLVESNNNTKFIFIIRDIRSLINSAINNRGSKLENSSIRPINYYIRYWIKSFYIIRALKKNKKFKDKIYFLKYENLINNTTLESKKLFKFIGINSKYKITSLNDQFGNKWFSNSSFNNFKSNVIKKNHFNNIEIKNNNLFSAITKITYYELKNLNYLVSSNDIKKMTISEAYNIISKQDKIIIHDINLKTKYKNFFIGNKNIDKFIEKEINYKKKLSSLKI